MNQHFLSIAAEAGIDVYRGNAPALFEKPTARADEHLGRRFLRLADSYVALGPPARVQRIAGMVNVQASLFRPYRQGFALPSRLRLSRILGSMRRAASRGELFHLWFHPHHIGDCLEENLAIVSAIVTEGARLRDAFGWPSLGMATLADAV